jgi:serine/threonine protein kinase/Tol biopolymer transport system component
MTPERWQQIREVLEKALDLAPVKRSAFLEQACAADSSLRQEVETLLASSDDVRSSFLQSSAPRVTLTTGTRLGEYEVKSLLGSGGMGEVYRAHDARLGRDVAIKILPPSFSANPDRLRRFEQEARAAAALNHPNILAVFQMGTYEGAPYLVSELLDGETLREQFKHGRLSVRKTIDYGMQIARGLAVAHEKGIVHRDMKPENLFVTKDGRLKILDFGLAKLTQPQPDSDHKLPTLTGETEAGVVMGTVGYMSPEQVLGQSVDYRTDIFAFGAILYEMLAGKRAFEKPTSPETMTAILNDDPPGISQVATNTPPALQRVVHRCLEKNREQRFQSASDLAFALDALSESARSAEVSGRDARGYASSVPARRSLRLTTGLAVLVLLTGAALYLIRKSSTKAPNARLVHKQFTFVGNAYWPAISPDGLYMAYATYNPGDDQKLVVEASDGAKVELAQGKHIGIVNWSPDGTELLFFLMKSTRSKTQSSTIDSGYFVVSRLGGLARPIDKGAMACWLTPDGSQIVSGGDSEAGLVRGVRIVNQLSGEVKEVPQAEYQWLVDIDCSPRTGMILAVTQTTGEKSQIRIFRPDGSGERTVVDQNEEIPSARWSPSGDSIYYMHANGNTKALTRVSVASRDAQPTILADGLQSGDIFSVSADGSRLAYTREEDYSNLWRVLIPVPGDVKKAKAEIARVTSGTSFYGEPSFSPDGEWLCYDHGPNRFETHLFKMAVADGRTTQLTFLAREVIDSPAWSPDGQSIAFFNEQDGKDQLWMVSANGGTAHLLKNNVTGTNKILTWWPSPEIVYEQDGLRNLLRMDEANRAEKPIIQQNQSLGWVPEKPRFSPDSKKLAIFWNRGKETGLWIISLEPYSETLLQSGILYPLGWSPDGKYIYALAGQTPAGAEREIIRLQVAAPHTITPIAVLPSDVFDINAGSVSPDGREIFVSIDEFRSDLWTMENFDPAVQ